MRQKFDRVHSVHKFGTHPQEWPTVRQLFQHGILSLVPGPLIMLYGGARTTAIDDEGRSFVHDTHEGDLWYFPTGIPHSIQGLAPDGAEFLLVFADGSSSEYATVLLSDLMAHTPKEVLSKNFGIPESSLATLRNKELFIVQGLVTFLRACGDLNS